MMAYLLDTHIFLWWIADDPRLPPSLRDLLADPGNTLFFSAASAWEMAIKAQIGKLEVEGDPATFLAKHLQANAMNTMPVQISHAVQVFNLPLHHRDPFDRLLIAQSQVEGLPILSTDPLIRLYDVEVVG